MASSMGFLKCTLYLLAFKIIIKWDRKEKGVIFFNFLGMFFLPQKVIYSILAEPDPLLGVSMMKPNIQI